LITRVLRQLVRQRVHSRRHLGTYALELARRNVGFKFGEAERAYVARMIGRDAYQRAMETCQDTKAWDEGVKAAA